MKLIIYLELIILLTFLFPVFTSSAFSDMSPIQNYLPENKEREYYIKEMEISAYNTIANQTDNSPCISANGTNVCKEGNWLASNQIKLGTAVEIEGKTYINVDRMNSRYTNHADICMGYNIKKAKEWGRKVLLIKIYK